MKTELDGSDPILQFIAGPQAKESTLLEIVIDGGEGAVYLDSSKIVAFITYPPIMGSMTPDAELSAKSPQKETLAISHTARTLAPEVEASRIMHVKDFLSPDEHKELLDFVLRGEKKFANSAVDAKDKDYRRSLVMHQFPRFSALILEKIKAMVPEVTEYLGMENFEPGRTECQLTASKDGHFYKTHNDNGSASTSGRTLTYVYYFNRQPKAFTGGDLRLYDTVVRNGYYVAAESYQDIEPIDNSIIFFYPRYMHEVLPVQVASKKFEDSRFTINGWLWEKS